MLNGKFIYAVDFDGTLSNAPFPECGNPNTTLIKWLIERRIDGHKVILWTCRMYDNLDAAVQWCRDQGLEFDAINRDLPELEEFYGLKPGDYHPKIYADYYIDDMWESLAKNLKKEINDLKFQIREAEEWKNGARHETKELLDELAQVEKDNKRLKNIIKDGQDDYKFQCDKIMAIEKERDKLKNKYGRLFTEYNTLLDEANKMTKEIINMPPEPCPMKVKVKKLNKG